VRALSRADAALGEISGLGRHLPNAHLLIAPYVRREAVAVLEREGLSKEISGRAWGWLYLAQPILKAIESPPESR
jgi:hypothetical protein